MKILHIKTNLEHDIKRTNKSQNQKNTLQSYLFINERYAGFLVCQYLMGEVNILNV